MAATWLHFIHSFLHSILQMAEQTFTLYTQQDGRLLSQLSNEN